MTTAPIIIQDGQQMVVLPGDMQVPGKEVEIKRVGRAILLLPQGVDPWSVTLAGLNEVTEDFMEDRVQPKNTDCDPFAE